MKGRGTGGSPAKEPPKKNRRKPKPGHNRAAQAVEHLIEVVREKLALLGHFLAFIVLFIATPIRRLAVAIFSGVAWVARQLSHLGTGEADAARRLPPSCPRQALHGCAEAKTEGVLRPGSRAALQAGRISKPRGQPLPRLQPQRPLSGSG